jgi:hypothetical protein
VPSTGHKTIAIAIIGSATKTDIVAAVTRRRGLLRMNRPNTVPPNALTTNCPAIVDPTPSCFR